MPQDSTYRLVSSASSWLCLNVAGDELEVAACSSASMFSVGTATETVQSEALHMLVSLKQDNRCVTADGQSLRMEACVAASASTAGLGIVQAITAPRCRLLLPCCTYVSQSLRVAGRWCLHTI